MLELMTLGGQKRRETQASAMSVELLYAIVPGTLAGCMSAEMLIYVVPDTNASSMSVELLYKLETQQ